MQKKSWFETWFDSSYYHMLYGHRDQSEAAAFIQELLQFLNPPKDSKMLDLACGSGRHALEIANAGFDTIGIDLSANNITKAKELENEHLSFYMGDMRHVHFPNNFNYIFNLFTSFGYFEQREELEKTLQAINKQLKPNGILVLDYLNVHKVKRGIGSGTFEHKTISGVDFEIRKRVSSDFVSKQILVNDGSHNLEFFEHVWNLGLDDFKQLLSKSDFTLQTIFGDYELNNFDSENSDRLILVASKL